MKNISTSLLPKTGSYWEALIRSSLNIMPRFPLINNQGFKRLIIFSKLVPISLIILYFLGYQPTLAFPPISKAQAIASENSQTQEVVSQITPEFKLPHPGYISTKYSWYHPGLDLATGFGSPIHPIAEGTVTQINQGYLGYGNHVLVSHQNGFTSLYGHMGKN